MTLTEALAILAPRIPEGTVCIHANGFIGRAGHAPATGRSAFT
jgi:hypothetical protein